MPIRATDIRRGQALLYEGQLQVVLSTEHVKPGKGPAYVQAKMKNIETGTIKVNRLGTGDRLEDVSIERRPVQYLYDAGGRGRGPYVFMDAESFDQVELGAELLGEGQVRWLKEGLECVLIRHGGRVLALELPATVDLVVTETAPQSRSATATNQLKDALLETGARVRVPPFVENGQKVRINTETGGYMAKA